MAEFKLTEDEYKTARWLRPIALWKKVTIWVIFILLMVLSIVGKQYAFSLLWLVLGSFVYISTNISRMKMERNRTANNPFALGPFFLEFQEKSYLVCMGQSKFDLSFDQLGRVHEIGDMYRLDHKSGFSLSIPKRALSNDELEVIKKLKGEITGWPENKAVTDW